MEIEGLIVLCCSDFMQVFFILKRLLAFELKKGLYRLESLKPLFTFN